jgi:hypothetical protein
VPTMPNTPPHFGTIVTFSLAFSLAQRLKKLGKNVKIMVGLVDTGSLPTDRSSWENIEYQKSIAYTGAINNYLTDFQELLAKLSSGFGGIDYQIVNQSSFGSHRKVPEIVRRIINKKEEIGQLLFPETKLLGLRSACPECGLADRHGVKNRYQGEIISFYCPSHG